MRYAVNPPISLSLSLAFGAKRFLADAVSLMVLVPDPEAFVPLCGVRLVGAFHVALLPDDECAKLLECPPSPSLHQHYRYFFDPPEMTTLGVSTNSGAHWAYWRDEPDQVPPIVVHSCDPAVCELYTDHASFLSVLKERVIAPKPAANKATKQLLQAAIHAAKCETAKTAVSARAKRVVATPFNLVRNEPDGWRASPVLTARWVGRLAWWCR